MKYTTYIASGGTLSDYDSRPDTYDHIAKVSALINCVIIELLTRAHFHDHTKLHSPEVEAFDEVTPLLAKTEYGTEEYRANLRSIKPALEHHYENNRHHPEHFENGIEGMNLVDLLEMLCDWKAASLRMAAPRASLEGGEMTTAQPSPFIESVKKHNMERYGIGPQLGAILLNSAYMIEKGWTYGKVS